MRIPSIILVALLPSLASASAPTCGPSTVPCLSDVACEPNSTTSSCTSPLDFVLAVDTSSGMRSSMGAVKDFMKEFIGKFTLSDLGPKVALLTFNSDEATALSDLSSNATALLASIDGMGDAAGLTSVKVGLDEAQAILNNASRGARVGYAAPIVLLLSDGEDSATGGGLYTCFSPALNPNCAMKVAVDRVKAGDANNRAIKILWVGWNPVFPPYYETEGSISRGVPRDYISSSPVEEYYVDGGDPEKAIKEIDGIVKKACITVQAVCPAADGHCSSAATSIVVAGRGFRDVDTLRCRIGDTEASAYRDAAYVNSTRIRCESAQTALALGNVDPSDWDKPIVLDVSVSVDDGTHWTPVGHAGARVTISCRFPPPSPPPPIPPPPPPRRRRRGEWTLRSRC